MTPESFFVLTREHPGLAADEIAALAGAYGGHGGIRTVSGMVLVRSAADPGRMARRAAFVRASGRILQEMPGVLPGPVAAPPGIGTFACRATDLSSGGHDIPGLESAAGGVIARSTGAGVSFEDPDAVFHLLLTDAGCLLGVSPRAPGEAPPAKPRHHPSELDRRLARAMINLAGFREGETVCDPFCGTGTVLLEAGHMGMGGIGVDFDAGMCEMARENAAANGYDPEIVRGDFGLVSGMAGRYDGIVTDLPYGRNSRTAGDPGELLGRLLSAVPAGKRLAVMFKRELGRGADLAGLRRYEIYRHKSLTRTVAVR